MVINSSIIPHDPEDECHNGVNESLLEVHGLGEASEGGGQDGGVVGGIQSTYLINEISSILLQIIFKKHQSVYWLSR